MENHLIYRRVLFLIGMSFLLFGCLIIQLVKIQVVEYTKLTEAAAEQHHFILLKQRINGSFFDRNLRVIRGPVNAKYLLIVNKNANVLKSTQLADCLGVKFITEARKNLNQDYWVYSRPLTSQQVQAIKCFNYQNFQIINGMCSPKSTIPAWHILGIDSSQSKSGLESSYQEVLKKTGQFQEFFSVIDGMMTQIPGLGLRFKKLSNKGGLVLTLDSRIQQIVENIMDEKRLIGAVVVMKVKTGEILAMASRPMVNFHNILESINNPETPFLNRAVSAYPPGSLFKLVTLSAGLDSGILKKNDRFFDPGYFQIGTKKWLCTTSAGHGHQEIDLGEALAFSCNTVFIEAAIRIRPLLVLKYAEKFGFGVPCNIGLADETWGKLPSGFDLSLGEQANLALGQQFIKTTPLQIASLIQTIANDGIRIKPTLVKGYYTAKGEYKNIQSFCNAQVISFKTARIVQEMMAGVTKYGTGKEADLPGGVGGKTGTAQIGNRDDLPDHAWFAGYLPLTEPRLVGVVFCENGISGGKTAAPIFKEIMGKVNKIRD